MPVTNYITVRGRIISEITDGQVLNYHSDMLGNVHMLTDQNGDVVKTMRYKPFGEVLSRVGSIADRAYQWVGSYGYRATTSPSSSHYVRARHYSAQAGSWTTGDPLWPEESGYGYVLGAVSNYIDYFGARPFVIPRPVRRPWSPPPQGPTSPGVGTVPSLPSSSSFYPPPVYYVPPGTTCILPGGAQVTQQPPKSPTFKECVDLRNEYKNQEAKGLPAGCSVHGPVRCIDVESELTDHLNNSILNRIIVINTCDKNPPNPWEAAPEKHFREMCNRLKGLLRCARKAGCPIEKKFEAYEKMCKNGIKFWPWR